ncbi:RNA 3'-terminal phosphate cyclase [Nanoarchaeota archaeon]
MIKLDGSYGEGGGQILRTALALSTLTQKSFEMDNIRGGKCDTGIKNQHLHCIKALKELCSSYTEGAELGSHNIRYDPGKFKSQTLSIDVGTAGSITLMMQALLLPAIFSEKKVKYIIKGGTDVNWSMPFDYFKEVFLPHLAKYADIECKLLKRGYFPKGAGEVEITIKPKHSFFDKEMPKINLTEQGKLIQVKGVSHASKDLENAEVAERQASAARHILSGLGCPVRIETEYSDSLSTGSGITLWAVYSKDENEIDSINPIRIGADSLGEKGKRAEVVGQEAGERLLEEMKGGAPVDGHLADQLIPFLVLNGEKMKVGKISEHTRTNIYVVEQFLDVKFKIDEENKIISI